jgi:hypothetical protein
MQATVNGPPQPATTKTTSSPIATAAPSTQLTTKTEQPNDEYGWANEIDDVSF